MTDISKALRLCCAFPEVTVLPNLLQQVVNNYSRKSQKTPEQ